MGKIPNLTNIFQMGWFNHQLVVFGAHLVILVVLMHRGALQIQVKGCLQIATRVTPSDSLTSKIPPPRWLTVEVEHVPSLSDGISVS